MDGRLSIMGNAATNEPVEAATPPVARRSATIYDVARAADVSHQSVSRYMRGMGMRPGTKAKIEKALETLEYKPNLSARALITGKSLRIGALTHETHQVGPGLIIQGATAAARDAGYLLDTISLDMGDPQEIGRALALLMQYDLAGILAFTSTDSMRSVLERADFDVPIVIAAEDDEPTALTNMHTSTQGIRDLVDYLHGLGHREFLHIAGPADWSAARNRLRAFESAVRSHGIEPLTAVHGDWSARSAAQLIDAMDAKSVPTAILAANDQMALGVIHALHEKGLLVPSDVSVTGLDDTPESPYYSPALTTVHLDFLAQGRDALNTLLCEIGAPSEQSASQPASPASPLVIRASTGPATRD